MFFSIICPTFNSSVFLEKTLNSLLAQTHKKFEIIFSDDGSQDNTIEILENYRSKFNDIGININIVKNMWHLVGMKVDIMDPKHHDMILAITSHIPHIIAYSIVGTVANLEASIKKAAIKYAASGFRDFTRIAAADPTMWRDIILLNKEAILEMLKLFKQDLSRLENSIKEEDKKFLFELFSKTRKIRKDVIN